MASYNPLPSLPPEELRRYEVSEVEAVAIQKEISACFADSEIREQLISDFRVTGVSLGIGGSLPTERTCASCIDWTYGFFNTVVRCCETIQGKGCEPCSDGLEQKRKTQ